MGEKVSDFDPATLPLDGEEWVPIIKGGTRARVQLKNLPGGGGTSAQETILLSGGQLQLEVDDGTDLSVYLPETIYKILGTEYTQAEGVFALALRPSAGLARIDVGYLDATGFHIATGTESTTPVRPTVPSGSIELSDILVGFDNAIVPSPLPGKQDKNVLGQYVDPTTFNVGGLSVTLAQDIVYIDVTVVPNLQYRFDGSLLVSIGAAGGAAVAKATSGELNTGTDDAKFATALALENSKYLNQSGNKISATASGTNTYAAIISPAITAYAATQRFFILFTNGCTGACTLSLNGLSPDPLTKNGGAALVQGDIPAGSVQCIARNGSNWQIVGSINALPVVLSGEKVVTVKFDGPHADYSVKDAWAATSTTATELESQDWSTGEVTYTGEIGEMRQKDKWLYFCPVANTWWRSPFNMQLSEFIYGASASDTKTSPDMVADFPLAPTGSIVTAPNGMYMALGSTVGWMYFANTITT